MADLNLRAHVHNKDPSKETKQYIEFVQSDDMKKTTKKLGYIPMSDMKVEKGDKNKVTKIED